VPSYATEHTALLAIDGNSSTYNYTNGASKDNWLQIAFPKAVEMSKIVVLGSSYKSYRLEDASVYVSSQAGVENLDNATKIGTLNGTNLEQSFVIDKEASYVFVKASGSNKLHVATVEVYGTIIEDIETPSVDLANKFGKATQGKTRYGHDASFAIDANTSTYSYTEDDTGANWWQVKLPKDTLVSKVMIQGLYHTDRLAGAKVYLTHTAYDKDVTSNEKRLIMTLVGNDTEQIKGFNTAKRRSYLLIKAPKDKTLGLGSVEVYGTLPTAPIFENESYSVSIDKWQNKTQSFFNVNAVDYQEDVLVYSIEEDVPFTIDAEGNLMVDDLLVVQDYTFNVLVSDGINSVTQEMVVTVRGATQNKEPFKSSSTSPAVTGYLPNTYEDNDVVSITVQGRSYGATAHEDGTWNIEADAISPALAVGSYDVTLVVDGEEILYPNYVVVYAPMLKKSEFNLEMQTITDIDVNIESHTETALLIDEKVRGTSITLKVEGNVTTLENKSYREIKSLLGSYVDANGNTVFVKLNFNQNILPYSTNTLTSFANDNEMKIVSTANMFDMEFSFGGVDCSEGIGTERSYYCQPTDDEKANYSVYFSMYNHFYNSVNGLSVMNAWLNDESYKDLTTYTYKASNYFSDETHRENYYYRNLYDILIPNMRIQFETLKGWDYAEGRGNDKEIFTLFGDRTGRGHTAVKSKYLANITSGGYQFIHHEMYHGFAYEHNEGMSYGWSDVLQNAVNQLDSYTVGENTVIDVPNYIVESSYVENGKIQLTVYKTSNATQSDVTFEAYSSSGHTDAEVFEKGINDGVNQVTFTTENSILGRHFVRVYASDSDEVMSLFIRPSDMTKTKLVSSNTKTYHAISNADWKRSVEGTDTTWNAYKSSNICQAWFGGDARTASLAEANLLHRNYQTEIDGIDWLDSKRFLAGENDSVGFKEYDYTQNAYVESSVHRHDLVTDAGSGILCVE
jgi:hypothetical protein